MASNFDFLKNRYATLHEHAAHAERLIRLAPALVASLVASP